MAHICNTYAQSLLTHTHNLLRYTFNAHLQHIHIIFLLKHTLTYTLLILYTYTDTWHTSTPDTHTHDLVWWHIHKLCLMTIKHTCNMHTHTHNYALLHTDRRTLRQPHTQKSLSDAGVDRILLHNAMPTTTGIGTFFPSLPSMSEQCPELNLS